MATRKPKSVKAKPEARKVFIRTVTSYYTGEVLEENESAIVLVKAAWIADTGRFAQAMVTGEFSEVEPYPDPFEVAISLGSVIDLVRNWPHALPRTQK